METKKDDVINFHIEKDLPVIKFLIEDDVPESEQMERFEKWLEDNKPSQAQVRDSDLESDTSLILINRSTLRNLSTSTSVLLNGNGQRKIKRRDVLRSMSGDLCQKMTKP